MANSRQKYFILRADVPIAKTNNFLRNWLNPLNADHVLKGELLVKETQLHDSNHAIYSLALDKSKKVSCSSSDVAPLDEDSYEWLVAIQKPQDRYEIYTQQYKLEAVKMLKITDTVWVSVSMSDKSSSTLPGSSCCLATVQYIGPIQDIPGRWIGVNLKVRHKVSPPPPPPPLSHGTVNLDLNPD